jgi:hypothetical protein
MGLRDRLRRFEEEAERVMIVIPQKDGTVKRFPPDASMDAYINFMDRLSGGEDAPPEHSLIAAARNSSDPKWLHSFFAVEDPDEWIMPVPDLRSPESSGDILNTCG